MLCCCQQHSLYVVGNKWVREGWISSRFRRLHHPSKPTLLMKHPAKFSDPILDQIEQLLVQNGVILDPFAGTGKIHLLCTPSRHTIGVEIEPEWATLHPQTIVGNALQLPFHDNTFDAIVTSPVYGNRMSDHHNAKDGSVRHTYRHTLGRQLHPDNSGQLQWGNKYKTFHQQAWKETTRVLKPGGQFILNISDHIRKGEIQPVTNWHLNELQNTHGLQLKDHRTVPTKRNRMGSHRDLRVTHEHLYHLEAPH